MIVKKEWCQNTSDIFLTTIDSRIL